MIRSRATRLFLGVSLAVLAIVSLACGSTKEVVVEVEKIVQVPVEKIVEVEVIEVVEVVKEVVVKKEVIKIVEVGASASETTRLTVVVADVGVPVYHRYSAPEPMITYPTSMGLVEHLMDFDGVALTPMIASAWEVDEIGVVFTIRDDIPWHDSQFGNVTVEDAWWSFEEMVREGSQGGWAPQFYGPLYENQRVEDGKVKWDWKAGPHAAWSWSPRHMPQSIPVESKKLFDEKGIDYANANGMGTGPYSFVKHVPDDQIHFEGVKNHWRLDGAFDEAWFLEVPEGATRIAMLRSGDADLSMVPLPLLDQVKDIEGVGYAFSLLEGGSGATIHFGGNFRIRVDQITGLPMETELRTDFPWVGETYEKGQMVRQAMSMAIDRHALNDEILGGQGCVAYTAFLNTCDPHYEDKWSDPYDPEGARALLAEAGFPDGFEFNFWVPGDINETHKEVSEAIANMWTNNLGLDVTLDLRGIGIRIDELAQTRSMYDIWSQGGGSTAVADSWLNIIPCFNTTIVFNCGYDFPEAYEFEYRLMGEFNSAKAWAGPIHDYIDFTWQERLSIATLTWLDPWVTTSAVSEFNPVSRNKYIPEIETAKP
jgi:ABC-type transport system substrate-binding protein